MKVDILTRKLIKPSIESETPNQHESLKLSFFDQLLAPVYIAFVLYYPKITNHEQFSKKLQDSLSQILTKFYPFAGRYMKENLSIECNDEGIEFLEAQVTGFELSKFLDQDQNNVNNVIELINQLFSNPFESQTSPLITIQFNVFECGGVAVGVTMTHRIADTFTMSMFMDGWATASRFGIEKACIPSFPFASVCPVTNISTLDLGLPSIDFKTIKLVTRRFLFSGAALSRLKEHVTNQAGLKHDNQVIITRVKAVIALLWRVLIKVSKARHGHYRPAFLALTLNMRSRTCVPLPENPCGNFISMASTLFEPGKNGYFLEKEHDEANLYSIVCNINKGINEKLADVAQATKPEDFVSMASRFFNKLKEAHLNKTEMDMCVVSSWCGFPLNVDFGFGKADWVSNVVVPVERTITLMDGKDGGIEAWINLDQKDMVLFAEDEEILAFTT